MTKSILLLCIVFSSTLAQAGPLARDRDPVVMSGAPLSALTGMAVDRIAAFRYQNGWQQIPVQIDEKKWVDYGTVNNRAPVGYGTMAYTDSGTYVGADNDLTFDSNDEIVVMTRDAGSQAPGWIHSPAGAASAGVEVAITDPLTNDKGYIYLFGSDGSLDPAAGQDLISYTFFLLGGRTYIPNYNLLDGPNPEDSQIVSPYYHTRFNERWRCDQLNVYAGDASGVDILDRHKNMFAPGDCARTENTFCSGPGAFFTNKDGPIRAIRSYMGANSGPYTQREHFFYEQRQDAITYLRVHQIGGVMDVYDYSPESAGMIYYNNLNTGGAMVNGVPDAITPGAITWEMVTGVQGSLIIAQILQTNISPFAYTSYYSDDTTPTATQCTGDAYEYATSGLWVNQAIPNTDPTRGAYSLLSVGRIVYYEPPGQTATTAATRSQWARNPLAFAAQPYPRMAPGDSDGDGNVDSNDLTAFRGCMTGPEVAPTNPACIIFDLDGDIDVDQADFGLFQRCLSGESTPANPNCTN